MKRIWPLVVLGLATYLLLAIVTLPASLILSRLPPSVATAGVEGTVWNGRAQIVQIAGVQIGSVSWKLHALPLFAGRVRADLKVTRRDGFIDTRLSMPMSGGPLSLSNLTGSLPLAALPPSVAPGGWTGIVNARLEQLELANGWPTQIEGTVEIENLTGPARRPVNVGSYKATFPPGTAGD